MSDEDEPRNPLEVATLLNQSLESLENLKEREKIVQYYKDKFVAERLLVSSKSEALRLKALEAVAEKMNDKSLPVTALIKLIEVLNKGGESDLNSLNNVPGVNVNIGNNAGGQVIEGAVIKSESGTLKKIGHTLEALQAISKGADLNSLKDLKNSIEDADFTEVKNDSED